jgi:Mrp family chromosome partitioning ATPase
MLGRSRLPVLAELSGPPDGTRAWSLRRDDFAALEGVLPRLEDKRVVLVGGDGGEVTTAGIAVAAAAAANGIRAICVECDLAQPRLAALIGVAPSPGLHEYLRWEAEPADVLRPVVLAGQAAAGPAHPLVCICAGGPATDPETLLGLQSFSHMIEKLRNAYALVLLIAPLPANEPGPCQTVARQADAVIAALPAAAVRGRAGRETRAAVRRLPPPVLGAIAIGSP